MTNNGEQEFSVKSVLTETFAVFKTLYQPLLLVYLAWLFLFSVLSMLMGVGNAEDLSASSLLFFIAIAFILSAFLSGTLTATVWGYLNGVESPVKEGFNRCIEVMLPLLGATFLVAAFVLMGLILLVIPGVIVALVLCLVTPIVVIENPGISNSLKRSYELTEGNKVNIFFLILILLAAVLIPTIFLMSVDGMLGFSVSSFILPLVNGLATVFNITMYVVIYRQLSQKPNGSSLAS